MTIRLWSVVLSAVVVFWCSVASEGLAADSDAAKSAAQSTGARIVRHPGKHSGHVKLVLCTAEGKIENRTITRSSKEAYKHARKAEWGDLWIE